MERIVVRDGGEEHFDADHQVLQTRDDVVTRVLFCVVDHAYLKQHGKADTALM
jgi:hypothetical protein